MRVSSLPRVLMIGNNASLVYLLERYAQQGGYLLRHRTVIPPLEEIRAFQPDAILFSSLEELEMAQSLIAGLDAEDPLILVCSSLADEERARELGADQCITHPLTYDKFCSALSRNSAG